MTLDELELRVEAVFPGASVGPEQEDFGVRIGFASPIDLIENCVDIVGFEVWNTKPQLLVRADVVDDQLLMGAIYPVEVEIVRRLEGVTAHQLIAARRRMMAAADAH